MACATLKRSLDWESLNQRPTKRRRCNPFTNTSGTAQNANAQVTGVKVTEPTQSAFVDTSLTKLTPGMLKRKPQIILQMKPFNHGRFVHFVFVFFS